MFRFAAANHTRENFGLAIRERSIVRKGHPKRRSGRMRLFRENEQTATGNIVCFTQFNFLTEGRMPTQAGWKSYAHAAMFAGIHSGNSTARGPASSAV